MFSLATVTAMIYTALGIASFALILLIVLFVREYKSKELWK